jgi:3-deoxy-D-manno-octulosonate 8-phosphate phosphatase (KDO 8-P phosphatase)
MSEKNYKEKLNNIKAFIFDVDGVLTDGRVLVTTSGEMHRSLNTKDGFAMKFALTNGYKIAIISGGTNEGVRDRFEELGVQKVYLGVHQKDDSFDDFVKENNLNSSEVLYMGDDIPDLSVMEKSGLSTCPKDAVTDVKDAADYISHKKGGDGCVREIIEQVLRVKGDWPFGKNNK